MSSISTRLRNASEIESMLQWHNNEEIQISKGTPGKWVYAPLYIMMMVIIKKHFIKSINSLLSINTVLRPLIT